jgi:hypothetical protein
MMNKIEPGLTLNLAKIIFDFIYTYIISIQDMEIGQICVLTVQWIMQILTFSIY